MLDDQDKPDRTEAPKFAWRAWGKWLLLFIPIMAVFTAAEKQFGFRNTFPLLIGILALTFLYQRYVKKRTWRSIMWGTASDK